MNGKNKVQCQRRKAECLIRKAEGNMLHARKEVKTAIKQLQRAAILLQRTGNTRKAAELRIAIRIFITIDDLIPKGISFN
ncbi:hypothetical protein [Paenibacillus roseipurpureus]|uniref:Uncharacterized protein n=1 Tax=Paenibacillus roseopurpureus TaxID=2918901 RepID=A0AA96RM72_9BACL|nr:hypothetical protein [Paenibacillus sp. MBLB1832]WNR43912.1 hypothetical protein MJB10_22895 [Paenibacillus sp. MBLB1832]